MPVHGSATTVKVSGTAVATTGEAVTDLGDDVYQVTNTAKRIIDPDTAVVVYDGVTELDEADYEVDYLFGKVTLADAPAGVVTADFSYLPMLEWAEAKGADWTRSRTLLDVTVFHATHKHRKRIAGLKDLKGSIRSLASLVEDLDSGVEDEQSLQGFHAAGTPKLLEVRPGGTGDFFRAWILLSSAAESAVNDGLVEASVEFEGAPKAAVGRSNVVHSGWGS